MKNIKQSEDQFLTTMAEINSHSYIIMMKNIKQSEDQFLTTTAEIKSHSYNEKH